VKECIFSFGTCEHTAAHWCQPECTADRDCRTDEPSVRRFPLPWAAPCDGDPTVQSNAESIHSDPPEALAQMDEAELIERVLAGDMPAARRLYDAYVGGVHRLTLRMTAQDELAQDATQETFVRVFRSLHRFRREATLATWIHQIAVSVTLNAIRGRKRWNAHRAELEDADQVVLHSRDAEPDLRDRLYAAIDALPAVYRAVFVLHEIEGHNHEEISALLRIPAGTSRYRLSEARVRLRRALRDFEGEWASA
jgi:RNA polymerase sigma-70 factor, ECF subfamily